VTEATPTLPAAPVPVHCPGCRRVLGHAHPSGLRVGGVWLEYALMVCAACGKKRHWGRRLPGKLHRPHGG
jgi:RNase P subunit RPR2